MAPRAVRLRRGVFAALLLAAGCDAPEPRVAAGVTHTCVLEDGRLRCFGDGTRGQLGLTGRRADAMDAGGDTTCAIRAGVLRCVGGNHRGQLGDGTTTAAGEPVEVLRGAVAVSVGYAHTCALRGDGTVLCWGWNTSGQVGGAGGDVLAPREVDVPPATRVEAGYDTTCALDEAGTLRCWGAVALEEPEVRDVAIGADHVCALMADALTCWGAEPGGGRPPLAEPWSVPVAGGRLAAGGLDHLCFTDRDGAALCLGKNTYGQLGRGDFQQPRAPSRVFELGGPVTSLSVGGEHSCAVVDAETWCWGWNRDGQLGKDAGLDSAVPVPVP